MVDNIAPITGTEKRKKFIAAGESRVNKALKAIDGIFVITDAEQYGYTEQDHLAIIAALNTKVEDLNKAFANKGPIAEGFTLETI